MKPQFLIEFLSIFSWRLTFLAVGDLPVSERGKKLLKKRNNVVAHPRLSPSCLFLLQEYPGKVRSLWGSIFVVDVKMKHLLGGVIIVLLETSSLSHRFSLSVFRLFLSSSACFYVGKAVCLATRSLHTSRSPHTHTHTHTHTQVRWCEQLLAVSLLSLTTFLALSLLSLTTFHEPHFPPSACCAMLGSFQDPSLSSNSLANKFVRIVPDNSSYSLGITFSKNHSILSHELSMTSCSFSHFPCGVSIPSGKMSKVEHHSVCLPCTTAA